MAGRGKNICGGEIRWGQNPRNSAVKMTLPIRVKQGIKEKSGAENTGQFSEKSEGAKLSNSLMVLG